MSESNSIGIGLHPEQISGETIPPRLIPHKEYIRQSQAQLTNTMAEFDQANPSETLVATDAKQIGQYLLHLYRHPETIAQEIHDVWVGDQEVAALQERQYQFMAPFGDMDYRQEIRKTRGDIKGVYRALQAKFADDLPVFERNAIDVPALPDTLEGLDGVKIAQKLMALAHDDAFIGDAAPFIHDTYLEAVSLAALDAIPASDSAAREQEAKKLEVIRTRPEGEAYQQSPNKARSTRNVRLDIIALAKHAQKVPPQVPALALGAK